ncbi:MAG: FAD/NAD(P)-binding protein [Patescibacteria group bacterium]
MLNPFQTQEAIILNVRQQTPGIKSFRFKLKSGKDLGYVPGQFFVFSLPGFGESVFVPTEVQYTKNIYDIAVQKVGNVTEQFHKLKTGDTFGIRGPYGNGFDMKKITNRSILLVAGGLGIVPLRSLLSYLTKRYCRTFPHSIQLFYGARSYKNIIFRSEIPAWKKCLKLEVTLSDPYPDTAKGWRSHAGLVTTLFKKVDVLKDGVAILCGPPVMFNAVIPKLVALGYKDDDIYLSMERRMECAGLGTCQHCAIGPYYVCKDGPVFTYAQLKDVNQY